MSDRGMTGAVTPGDLVIFDPDQRSQRLYGQAYGRVGIYPGMIGRVERITAGLIRIEGVTKAWPAEQFRPAAVVSADERAAIEDAFRRRYYGDEPSPYRVGDRVKFQPSPICDLWYGQSYRASGLFPSTVGTIRALRDDRTLAIDDFDLFFHWSEFTRVTE